MRKDGNSCCVYLDGDEGGVKENIYDCEIWITENRTLTSTASYREGNNACESLATLSLTSQQCAGAWRISQLHAVESMKKPLVQTSWLQKKHTQLVQAKGKKRKKYKQRGFGGFTGFLRDHKKVEPGVRSRTQDCCLFLWGSHPCFFEIFLHPLSLRASSDHLGSSLISLAILAPKGQTPVILSLNYKLPQEGHLDGSVDWLSICL